MIVFHGKAGVQRGGKSVLRPPQFLLANEWDTGVAKILFATPCASALETGGKDIRFFAKREDVVCGNLGNFPISTTFRVSRASSARPVFPVY